MENPKGTLVMGTNCEFEPFEYLTSDGQPTGFDVDYGKYLWPRWAMGGDRGEHGL